MLSYLSTLLVETIWIGSRKLIQKPLIALGIDMRKWQKKGFPCCRFNRTVKAKRFEQPLPSANGFDPTGSDQAPKESFESKAALILCKVANLSLSLSLLAVVLP